MFSSKRFHYAVGLLAALFLIVAGWQTRGLAFEPGIECDDPGPGARCTLSVAEGLALEAAHANTTELTGGYRLEGDLVLRTAVEEFELVEADVIIVWEPGSDTPAELFGVARPPIGKLPIIGDAVDIAPMAAVGLIGREKLKDLIETPENSLPLAENPVPGSPDEIIDPTYFFFHFETGITLDLGIAEILGLNTEDGAHDPFQYDFPGDVSLTMILDPADPYFYLSSDARSLAVDLLETGVEKAIKAKDDDDRRRESELSPKERKQAEKNRKQAERRREQAAKRRERERKNAEKQAAKNKDGDSKKKKKKKKKKKDKDKSGISLGSFAFSGMGGIPFEPETTWGLPEDIGAFKGHLLVETKIPLGYGVSIEGPVVAYVAEDGFEIGGNGDVEIGAELLGDIVGLSFPLGNASAGLKVREDGVAVYFSGLLSPDTSFLPPQVPIVPSLEVRLAAVVDSNRPEETRLVAEGEFNLGANVLGELAGVNTSKALVIQGELSIDRDGFWLRGTTTSSLHKDIVFAGEQVVEAYFSPTRLADSYILMSGDLMIGGVGLGAGAQVRLGGNGLTAEGFFLTPVSNIQLLGEVTRAGPRLEGHALVNFGLDGVNDAFDAAQADVISARNKVEGLDSQIAQMRAVVQSERDADAQRLRDAQAGVTAAQNEVNRIQSTIDSNNRRISQLRREIRDWKSWYKRQPTLKKPAALVKMTAEVTKREGQIASLNTANVGLKAALVTARGALAVANEVLRGVEATIVKIPVDADPRVAPLIVAREAAVGVLRLAESALAAFPDIGGDFKGEVHLELSRRGIRGSVDAALNGVTLAGGRVKLDGDPEACVDVPGLGLVCAPF